MSPTVDALADFATAMATGMATGMAAAVFCLGMVVDLKEIGPLFVRAMLELLEDNGLPLILGMLVLLKPLGLLDALDNDTDDDDGRSFTGAFLVFTTTLCIAVARRFLLHEPIRMAGRLPPRTGLVAMCGITIDDMETLTMLTHMIHSWAAQTRPLALHVGFNIGATLTDTKKLEVEEIIDALGSVYWSRGLHFLQSSERKVVPPFVHFQRLTATCLASGMSTGTYVLFCDARGLWAPQRAYNCGTIITGQLARLARRATRAGTPARLLACIFMNYVAHGVLGPHCTAADVDAAIARGDAHVEDLAVSPLSGFLTCMVPLAVLNAFVFEAPHVVLRSTHVDDYFMSFARTFCGTETLSRVVQPGPGPGPEPCSLIDPHVSDTEPEPRPKWLLFTRETRYSATSATAEADAIMGTWPSCRIRDAQTRLVNQLARRGSVCEALPTGACPVQLSCCAVFRTAIALTILSYASGEMQLPPKQTLDAWVLDNGPATTRDSNARRLFKTCSENASAGAGAGAGASAGGLGSTTAKKADMGLAAELNTFSMRLMHAARWLEPYRWDFMATNAMRDEVACHAAMFTPGREASCSFCERIPSQGDTKEGKALFTCPCRVAQYCDAACQTAHWLGKHDIVHKES